MKTERKGNEGRKKEEEKHKRHRHRKSQPGRGGDQLLGVARAEEEFTSGGPFYNGFKN